MSPTPARATALEVVTRVREREAFAHETLGSVLDARKLSERDSAFGTRLAYGTIACRGTLDEAVSGFVDPKHPLQPQVADAMAVAAYELLYARTPARAAVSEGVELVRSVQPKASRLANAVLRRLAEKAASFPWGDPGTDVAALARLYGHPRWMAELFVEELGWEAAASVMAADNEPAPLYLAHLPQQGAFEVAMDSLSAAGAGPEICEPAGCIVVRSAAAAVRSSAVASRQVVVADAGAQLAAAAVDARPGQRVIEIGAGRGTKTLILDGHARLQGGEARILAVDSHAFKLDALESAADAVGARGVETLIADATRPEALAAHSQSADRVLVDAPCSGLGTLRRHPDRRWRANAAEIESLGALGDALIGTAASLVRPGGFMVYSTCTIVRRENEDVVRRFLESEQGADFSVDPLGEDVPSGWRSFLGGEGFFRSLPAIGGPDGHFIAKLRRG